MKKLSHILAQFRHAHLLVVGDLMLDRFIWGDVERISPEAPVPVVTVTSESFRLGGAANVVNNIHSLGGRATACGVIGPDASGDRLLQGLEGIRASSEGVFRQEGLQTIQKSRIIARPRHQQIVRLDRENHREMSKGLLKRIREFVLDRAAECDGVVISDYGKGVVHGELLKELTEMIKRRKMLCVVDPKRQNFSRYRLATLVTPNREEASQAAGVEIRDESSLRAAGKKLLQMWEAQGVLITRGPQGASLFRPGRPVKHLPTEARDIFDVTGAGDTVVAACSLALACRSSLEEAAVIANLAAGLVGDEVGTVAVPLKKLKTVIGEKR